MSLTREKLDAVKLRVVEVDTTEEWGDTVFVRDIGGDELDTLIAPKAKETDLQQTYRMAAAVICDKNGVRLYPEGDDGLLRHSAGPVKRCADAFLDLVGLSEEGEEEIAGNSEATHSESIGSE